MANPDVLNPRDPLASVVTAMSGRNNDFQTYPGIDGIPHVARGVTYYKKDDPAKKKPQMAGRVMCEIFDLGKEEDRKRYQVTATLVYSMARHGKMVISAVDRQYQPDKGTWTIYFEWIELFTYDPNSTREHVTPEIGVLRSYK